MAADPSYNAANYQVQGGAEWVIGGTLTILGGATVTGLAAYTMQTAIADLTDNSGGATADDTIGAVTAPTALTVADGAGTNDGTIGAITADASVIAAVQELAAFCNAQRTATVALRDAVTELATKVNDILASLRSGGAIDT